MSNRCFYQPLILKDMNREKKYSVVAAAITLLCILSAVAGYLYAGVGAQPSVPSWRMSYSNDGGVTSCHYDRNGSALALTSFLDCMKQYVPSELATTTVNMTDVHCEGFDCKDLQKVIDATRPPTTTGNE